MNTEMLLINCIGVIFCMLLYYVCYNTYEVYYIASGKWKRGKRLPVPRWTILVALITLFISPLALIFSLFSWFIYMLHLCLNERDYEIDVPFIKFLMKSIYDTKVTKEEFDKCL